MQDAHFNLVLFFYMYLSSALMGTMFLIEINSFVPAKENSSWGAQEIFFQPFVIVIRDTWIINQVWSYEVFTLLQGCVM